TGGEGLPPVAARGDQGRRMPVAVAGLSSIAGGQTPGYADVLPDGRSGAAVPAGPGDHWPPERCVPVPSVGAVAPPVLIPVPTGWQECRYPGSSAEVTLSVETILKIKHFPCQLFISDFVFAALNGTADALNGGIVYFWQIADFRFNLLHALAAVAQFYLIGSNGALLYFGCRGFVGSNGFVAAACAAV